ncbi:MAG: HNH endonuclease domain-containing protein [Tenuifilaceae bacterium]|jgi:CRISPR-associated endonuclease Csn1|nr:HNH endonuclease domain-containing protein [Tenuifilaceae bacterium]
MKKILGLDLGTNSIGWALVSTDDNGQPCKIEGLGSRIIPMSQDRIGEFDKGNSVSQTAERTGFRGVRRLRERHLLRRERLHRVLNILGFLPKHYADEIDFEKRLGKFIEEKEPKLAYFNRQFIFQESFNEMLADFKQHQPQLLDNDRKLPYDWTIYYLRKKALSQRIDKEELAWLILNFNQKRGYYQLRGEEEEEIPNNKQVEFHSLRVVDVIADEEPNKKGDIWYSLHLENGWVYRRSSRIPLNDWKDKVRDFIVTTDLNDDGTIKKDKEGNEKRSFRAPGEDDWTLIKKKTEQEIEKQDKTVGAYIYDTLLQNPNQKIRGRLVRTIERKFYKEELRTILNVQKQFHPELYDEGLYNRCVRELYRSNESQQIQLSKKDFVHLFVEDIIFYQRPLRSQKSSIGRCPLEYRTYKDEKWNAVTEYLKAIPKSNPLYQEFRVWQWLYNLRILNKEDDKDVTPQFISSINDLERLFEYLMLQKEVDHKAILKHLIEPTGLKGKALNAEIRKYRWNYVYDSVKEESKKYPCNETGYEIKRRLSRVDHIPTDFLTNQIEHELWHIIYSVTDKTEFEKALTAFARKFHLDEPSFVENFKKFPPFKSEYGAYSEKAIKKLLPLMRLGRHWAWSLIDPKTQSRIKKIITGEYDEDIKNRVRDKAINLQQEDDFQGLQLWLAQYIVYDRHSEAGITVKWDTLKDLEKYLDDFKQHSLRNPIVEQIVTETLRVVKDIWAYYGNGSKDFFHEIHVELGREMKNTAEERLRLSNQITSNENTNLRIKALIAELKDNSDGQLLVENVRPYSPIQQEALKIFEDGVLCASEDIPEDILKISKTAQPSKSELHRYKLWLEQRYRSPYTGEMIPLSKLFTAEYEIEHVIPQSRYFDDGLSNKVICESAINKLKDNQLGLEFIKNHYGEIVETGFGKKVKVFTEEEYTDFVKKNYAQNRTKRNKLMLDEIPEKMIERQLNDTRYISKFVTSVLSNIVRSDDKDDGMNSKNILPVNGMITATLRKDWGLEGIWNDLILPRFVRMNQLSNSHSYTSVNTNNKVIPTVPIEHSKGFQKKRVDHRHHALDALTIACTTRNHINLLNNKHANSKERVDLNRKLRRYEKAAYIHPKTGQRVEREVPKEFFKPWDNFTKDAKDNLEGVVVSFKQNLRVINKTTNKYERVIAKNGKKLKELTSQTKGDSWAIRKPLHKDTVSGEVKLPWVKIPNGKILTATRKNIDTSFDLKNIESITDTGIQKILKNYLASKDNNPEFAFTPEGIEEMNRNIESFNDGGKHKPIFKVRVFEIGSKFPLGQTGNKKIKYVEAAKGTNLFFAIYQGKDGKRTYETIPLNIVIERQKQGLGSVPEVNEKGDQLLFHLSPNDLVYVPPADEVESQVGTVPPKVNADQVRRIYKMVSCTGTQCMFLRNDIASPIVNKVEFSPLNKMERSVEGEMIKDVCWKIRVDRIGNIVD